MYSHTAAQYHPTQVFMEAMLAVLLELEKKTTFFFF